MNAIPPITVDSIDIEAILKKEYESLEDINKAVNVLLHLTGVVYGKALSNNGIREHQAKKGYHPKVLDKRQFNKIKAALWDSSTRLSTLASYLDSWVRFSEGNRDPRTEPHQGAE